MRFPMLLGRSKALITAIALPPTSFILSAVIGLAWAGWGAHIAGFVLSALALVMLWLTSCNAVAVWMSRVLLPQVEVVAPSSLKTRHTDEAIEAVVVLGAGIDLHAPEFGAVQLSAQSIARLRYGVFAARLSGLPLAFAGGIGWAGAYAERHSEAAVARVVALADYDVVLRWADEESRDTRGNARAMAEHLKRDNVRRISLVTHAWHMPRATIAFLDEGLMVLPLPMGLISMQENQVLEWLPSPHGMAASRLVMREWLALRVASIRRVAKSANCVSALGD